MGTATRGSPLTEVRVGMCCLLALLIGKGSRQGRKEEEKRACDVLSMIALPLPFCKKGAGGGGQEEWESFSL